MSRIERLRRGIDAGKRIARVHISHQFIPFEKQETEASIPERFIRQAQLCPDRVAVKTEKGAITYSQLNAASARLANTILSGLGREEEPVALLMEQGLLLITSMLAVLKAGKFYTPLDPANMNSRDEYILRDCGARLLITDSHSLALAKRLCGENTRILIADETAWSDSDEDPVLEVLPQSFAYVLYTSGSTGKPRGVIQTHRNVLHNIMKYTNGIHISADDRISLTASPSVGASVSDIYGALLNGASLHPFALRGEGLACLADWLIEEQITIYHSVPSVFRYLAARLAEREAASKLRLIKLGGEPVYSKDIELYRKHFPDGCILHVGLGATEMNIIRQFFVDKRSDLSEGIVPVGYEVDETEVLLLDEEGRPAARDSVGEIAIRSRFLPAGYWRNPEATSRAFRPDPEAGGVQVYLTGDIGCLLPDGCLVHLGRKDSQVKIRGRKVELAEVELSLINIRGVKEAIVTAEPDEQGSCRLAAYVVAEAEEKLSGSQLRSQLKKLLPEYMIPSSYVMLEELPRTPGGKLDRRQLANLATAQRDGRTDFTAPRNHTEARLARLWESVLGAGPVGVRDDFFELGGDSLSAAELFARIEHMYGRAYPASTLLESPTVERLARLIEDRSEQSSLVPLRASGPNPPLFCVHGIGGDVLSFRDLGIHLGEDQPIYGLRAPGGNIDRLSVEHIAAFYIDEMKRVQPEGRYFLAGYSFGGTVAFEMARQLIAQGRQVGLLALFDTYGPGYPELLPITRRLMIHSSNLIKAGPEQQIEYLRGRININVIRTRKIMRRILYRFSMLTRRHPPARIEKNVQAAHQQALRDYVPEPIDARLTLFRADKQGEVWHNDPELGWGGMAAGGVEVHEVPGDHITLIAEPNVRVLARKLSECLLRARN